MQSWRNVWRKHTTKKYILKKTHHKEVNPDALAHLISSLMPSARKTRLGRCETFSHFVHADLRMSCTEVERETFRVGTKYRDSWGRKCAAKRTTLQNVSPAKNVTSVFTHISRMDCRRPINVEYRYGVNSWSLTQEDAELVLNRKRANVKERSECPNSLDVLKAITIV